MGYELVNNWPQLPADFVLGNPTGIGIDNNQRIYVFHRAGRTWPYIQSMPDSTISSNTIIVLDRDSGKIINSWGDSLFIMPHGLTIDKDNNIWVTDVGLHQVFKFKEDGSLLLSLGEARVPGADSVHFNRPTDVAVNNDGSFYVSDGYGNSRVIKFSSQGKYLFDWGKKGDKEGEFNIPHAISLGENENVYVADRENKRVQVFDSNGKFIKQLTNKKFGNISAVAYGAANNQLIAADDLIWLKLNHQGSDIIVFDSTRKKSVQFGRTGFYSGPVCWYHDLAIDKDGNIYAGDILGNSLQKFKKLPR
jgi:peptidylamidoglycolate lyase